MSEGSVDSTADVLAIERAVTAHFTRIMRWAVPLGVAVLAVTLVVATLPAEDDLQTASGATGASEFSASGGGASATGGRTVGSGGGVASDVASPTGGEAAGGGAVSGGSSADPGAPGGAAAGAAAPGIASGTAKSGVECAEGVRQVAWSKYAPTCVGAFTGDNGGDTAPGVTGDKIKVVVGFGNAAANSAIQSLAGPATPNDKEWADTIAKYAAFFNTQYETYGREVVVETYQMKSDYVLADMGRDTAAAQADAQTSKNMGAFIDLTALTNTSSLPYGNALADLGVISWSFPLRTADDYQRRAPYMYNFLPDGTKWARWATSLVCQRMAGMPAVHAGGAEKGKPRKFGVIKVNIPEWKAAADLTSSMMREECGVQPVEQTYEFDLGTFSQYGASMMSQMQSQGVTTILCVCDPLGPIFMTDSATSSEYFPEWLFHNQGIVDSNYNPQQLANSFSNGPALPPAAETEAFRVFRMAYPGEDPPSRPYFGWIYGIMLQVFGAVQMAGPDLNPATFASGMASLPASLPGGDYGPWFGDSSLPFGGTFTPWTSSQVTRWGADAPSPDGSSSGYWTPCPGPAYYPFSPSEGWGPADTQLEC